MVLPRIGADDLRTGGHATPVSPVVRREDIDPIQVKTKTSTTSRAVTTPTSRPVSMLFRNYNTNPVIDVRRRW